MSANSMAPEEAFDARRVLADAMAVARRRKALMLVVFLAVLVAGAVTVLTQARTYRAEAFLVVAGPAPASAASPTEVPVVADAIAATRSRSVITHIAAMKSPRVLGRAYDGLPQRVRAVFEREGLHVAVEAVEEAGVASDVLRISVSSRDPKAAAALANAIVREHLRYTSEFNRDVARSALAYLDAELSAARDKVEQADRALLEEKRRAQLFSPEGQIASETGAAIAAQRNADQAAVEYRIAKKQLASLRAVIAREPTMLISRRQEDRNPLADSLRSTAVNQGVSRSGMLVDFSPRSPEVRRIDALTSAAEKSLSGEKPRVTTTEDRSLNSVREALRQQAIELEVTAQAAFERERENRQLYERYVKELYGLSAAHAKLLKLTTAAEVLRENYRLLRERHQSIGMGAQARLPDVNILSPAEVPRKPVGPGKAIQVAFLVVASALLACGAAWLAEVSSPRRLGTQVAA